MLPDAMEQNYHIGLLSFERTHADNSDNHENLLKTSYSRDSSRISLEEPAALLFSSNRNRGTVSPLEESSSSQHNLSRRTSTRDVLLPKRKSAIVTTHNPDDTAERGSQSKSNTSRRHFLQALLIDSWAFECIALFMSATAFAAIVTVLGVYNGLLLEQWSHSIQLNTVISTLATLMKGLLLVAVCACLSQLKWLWYKPRSRCLLDFQTFDQASRGPWGAAVLLARLRFWHVASLGSVITLLALGIDSFVQQSVSYPLRIVTDQVGPAASIPIAREFVAVAQYDVHWHTPTPEIKKSICNGMYALNLSTTGSTVTAYCSSSNCTFQPYASLAVCSHCEDVTSLLQLESGSGSGNDTDTYALPNGLAISFYYAQDLADIVVMNTLPLNTHNLDKYQVWQQVGNLSIIQVDYWNYTRRQALDCVLTYCIKSYEAEIRNGIFNERVTGTCDIPKWHWADGAENTYDPSPVPSNLTIPTGQLPDIVTNRTFTLGWLASRTLATYFISIFESVDPLSVVSAAGTVDPEASNIIGEAFFYNGLDKLNATITNIADALTNTIRLLSTQSHQGTTQISKSYIHVRWLWLLLPLILLVLAVLFIALTIWESHSSEVPCWRSSALAIMEHGVSTRSGDKLENLNNSRAFAAQQSGEDTEKVSDLEHRARRTRVHLYRSGKKHARYGLVIDPD